MVRGRAHRPRVRARRGHHRTMSDGWDEDEREDRAPICPACGVTALPGDTANVIDVRFVCENPDCEGFGEVVPDG